MNKSLRSFALAAALTCGVASSTPTTTSAVSNNELAFGVSAWFIATCAGAATTHNYYKKSHKRSGSDKDKLQASRNAFKALGITALIGLGVPLWFILDTISHVGMR